VAGRAHSIRICTRRGPIYLTLNLRERRTGPCGYAHDNRREDSTRSTAAKDTRTFFDGRTSRHDIIDEEQPGVLQCDAGTQHEGTPNVGQALKIVEPDLVGACSDPAENRQIVNAGLFRDQGRQSGRRVARPYDSPRPVRGNGNNRVDFSKPRSPLECFDQPFAKDRLEFISSSIFVRPEEFRRDAAVRGNPHRSCNMRGPPSTSATLSVIYFERCHRDATTRAGFPGSFQFECRVA